MTIPDIAGEAESLVRALRGVQHASIDASADGIESIDVVATDDEAARHMASHVRSALLAGLAAPVLPGRIHVRVAEAESTDHRRRTDDGDQSADTAEPAPAHRDRIRLLHDAPDSHARPADRSGHFGEADQPEGPANRPASADVISDETAHDAAETAHDAAPSLIARPRLVAVDIDRPGDGRVVCRVAIAHGTSVHRAEAVAVDLAGAAAQAAAQAAVRALIDAGITGLELSGLREVEIAGRDYVLVALRRSEPFTRTRSGSAPIIGSPERSAAEATVAAAHEIT